MHSFWIWFLLEVWTLGRSLNLSGALATRWRCWQNHPHRVIGGWIEIMEVKIIVRVAVILSPEESASPSRLLKASQFVLTLLFSSLKWCIVSYSWPKWVLEPVCTLTDFILERKPLSHPPYPSKNHIVGFIFVVWQTMCTPHAHQAGGRARSRVQRRFFNVLMWHPNAAK